MAIHFTLKCQATSETSKTMRRIKTKKVSAFLPAMSVISSNITWQLIAKICPYRRQHTGKQKAALWQLPNSCYRNTTLSLVAAEWLPAGQPQGPPQPGGKGSLPCRALPAQLHSSSPFSPRCQGALVPQADLLCHSWGAGLHWKGEGRWMPERRVYSAQPETSENGVFNADPNLLPLKLRESSAAGSDSSAKHQELNSLKLLCYEITIWH